MSKAAKDMTEAQGGEVAPIEQSTSLIEAIRSAASDPDVNVDKMEKLLDMHERLTAKAAEKQYHAAMARAQSHMTRVKADATNPQTKSNYASYAALDRALRPIYTQEGFGLSFDTGGDAPEGFVRVLCHVSHESGHSRTYQVDMPADGKGAKGGDVMTKTHAHGSAMSYGMRYLLKLIFNVAVGEDDDDGNAAAVNREPISEKQALDIHALIDEVKADKDAYLQYLSRVAKRTINSVEEIPLVMHREAVQALENKRKKRGN